MDSQLAVHAQIKIYITPITIHCGRLPGLFIPVYHHTELNKPDRDHQLKVLFPCRTRPYPSSTELEVE